MKLFHKFFLPFLSVALVPLAFMGWSARRQVQSSLRRISGDIQIQTAKRASDHISQYLENIHNALTVAQDNPEFVYNRSVQSNSIRALLDNYPFFSGLSLFTRDFRLAYSSARSFSAWDGFGKDWPRVRETVRKNGFYLSPVTFSSAGYPETVLVTNVGSDPENPLGFLAGRINLVELSASLKSLDVGGGTILVYDKNSAMIAHSSEKDLFPKPLSPPDGFQKADEGEFFRDGKPMWWTKGEVGGMSDGWTVIFEQSTDIVFQAVNSLKRKMFYVFAGSVFLAVILCWIVIRRVVVDRLEEIQNAVEAIRNRNFNLSLKVNSGDEIGQLAQGVVDAAKVLEKQVRTSTIGIMIQKLSHDLRKPLTNIRGSLETARRHITGSDAVAEKHLGFIQEAVGQGLDYIEEMLTLGKDRRPPQKVPTDMNALIQSILERMHFPPGVDVSLKLGTVPSCPVDPAEVSRAFTNILSNAIDACPGSAGKIEISTAVQNGSVSFTIKDSGKGMSEEVQKKLFDDFFTTREGGTGLGMGIVKRVVERHDGKISVLSKLGEGTAMTLSFPA